jgi:hypothetical protein
VTPGGGIEGADGKYLAGIPPPHRLRQLRRGLGLRREALLWRLCSDNPLACWAAASTHPGYRIRLLSVGGKQIHCLKDNDCHDQRPDAEAAGAAGVLQDRRSEGEQVEFLRKTAEGFGATVRTEEVLPGRFNFYAEFAGRLPERPSPWRPTAIPCRGISPSATIPFPPGLRPRGLRHESLAAAMLAAACALPRRHGPGTVQVVSTCREETGGEGARAFAAFPRPDMTVVGEPTGLEIVRANKGAWRTRLTARGVAAHSSAPRDGRNAIVLMCEVVRALEAEFVPFLESIRNPVLGSPTMSVGTIRGGNVVNIVPEECSIEIDWRLVRKAPPKRSWTASAAGSRNRHRGI